MQPCVFPKTCLCIYTNIESKNSSKTIAMEYELEWGPLEPIRKILTPLGSNSKVDLIFHYRESPTLGILWY